MKKTPLIAVVTAVAFLFVGYYAGRRTPASTPTSTVAIGHQIARDTFDQVENEGRLIVGIGQEAAPFGYRDNGELVGYDVDIARAVVKRLEVYTGRKISLEFKPVSDETRISWVQSGEVHMSLCHTNITRKRLANVDF